MRAWPLIGQDATVHHASDHDSDPALRARRQQCDEGVLIEQGVAARDEEDVQLRLTREPGKHRRLVHPDADGTDDTLLTEPVQRRIGAVDRGLPMVVGIVDEDHVDPLEPEPLETLLERPGPHRPRCSRRPSAGRASRRRTHPRDPRALVGRCRRRAGSDLSVGPGGRPSSTRRSRLAAGPRARHRGDAPRSHSHTGVPRRSSGPQRPGPFDGPRRLVVADLTEEPAHGRRSETESSDLESVRSIRTRSNGS